MNYYQYNAVDLAADDYFKQWVCSPTSETDAFWRAFLKDYPERYYEVEEARQLIIGLHEIQRPPMLIDKEEAIWSRIEQTLIESRPAPEPRTLNWRQTWKVAASLILLVGAGWFGLFQLGLVGFPGSDPAQEGKWIEVVNDANHLMQVQLADGSRVELKKGGHLRYREGLVGTQREVFLIGEAFFNVRKNPQRPFIVYSSGLVTKVLGTSFRVNAPTEAPTVTVDVKTGRVSVYPDQPNQSGDPESTGMVLTPNQKAVYRREGSTLSKTLTDEPRLLNPAQPFDFDDASAGHVFAAIAQAYGIEIIFDEDVMQQCTLTMNLDHEDLFQKLDVICKVLDAHYKVIDAQIVIYSKGCSRP
ncbi:FecR family protein [Nibrella saemangeumensis]|uniref:FecR family protein n=1 Tax=Nibrella saemangeumensis TaxID=1084526 RepID=A0ABP8NE07_9BACT